MYKPIFVKAHFLDKAKLCIYFAASSAVHEMTKRLKTTGAGITLEECKQIQTPKAVWAGVEACLDTV
jgi:hypothetical protein